MIERLFNMNLAPWEIQQLLSDIGVFVLILLMIFVIRELIKTTKPGAFGAAIIIVVLMASPVVYVIKTLVTTFTHL